MNSKRKVSLSKSVLALMGTALFVSSCSSSSTTSQTTVATVSADITEAVKAAAWNPTIKIAYSDDSINFRPDGIPNHERDAYYAVPDAGVMVPDATTSHIMKDPTSAQKYSFDIPSTPTFSVTTTSTSLGSIGVMISGAVLYNPYEGDGKTVAMSSNFTITDASGITASFVDKCAGHPTPGMNGTGGAYHYHGLPGCVTSQVDITAGPSHIIGIALDGYLIYGANDIKGDAVPVSALDECNGITSPTPEFPNGIYHYVLPGTTDATSSIGCFHGVVDASQIKPMPNMGLMPNMGPMPDLGAAAIKLGITEAELMDALGKKMPPDFMAAAQTLGITETDLKAALGL
jgi:hypothetical protein